MLPFLPHRPPRAFWALRNITFGLERGEALAIVGPNGSGKSTLLQIITGILKPSSGRVLTEGRIAALLELGAGFNPEFSGRENVLLNGEIMGLSRREIERVFPDIERFAGIGQFIDRPVKEYSSGMYVRLAFSTAIHIDPDILIVDEALAVGDAIFASRCVQKFEELRQRKVTVLLVSHDLGLVKRLADRAILLLNGELKMEGSPTDVVNRYIGFVHQRESSGEPVAGALGSSFRHGDGASRIIEVKLLDQTERPARSFSPGERMTIQIEAVFQRAVHEPILGVLFRTRIGTEVFGTNTRIEGLRLGSYEAGERLQVRFILDCLLTAQEYTVTVATQNWDGTSQDWLDDVLSFQVVDVRHTAGVLQLPTRIDFNRLPPASEYSGSSTHA